MKKAIVTIAVVFLSACTHQTVNWDNTKRAAHNAAVHPSVWAPLFGAAIFSAANLDKSTSEKLSEDTPIFGNESSASSKSNTLESALMVTAVTSAMMVTTKNEGGSVADRSEHVGVVVSGLLFTGGITEGIKSVVARERPNNKNSNSFPSGHASIAFASATMASKNFHRIWGDDASAMWADAGVYTAASLTAWARVETNKHWATDVLVGAALGNFMGRFMDELLLNDSDDVLLGSFYDGKTIIISVEKKFN